MARHFRLISARLRNEAPAEQGQDFTFIDPLYIGEPTAWARFIEHWSPQVYSYLSYNQMTEAEALGLLQLIFAEVVQTIVGSLRMANLTTLIFSIAYHHVLHHRRQSAKRTLAQKIQWRAEEQRNPALNFLGRFDQCTPEAQQICLLYYRFGISLPEVAQIVNQSEEHLTNTLTQAKRLLL